MENTEVSQVFRSPREEAIARMIKEGKRRFTLIDAVDYCYPPGKMKRPLNAGRSVAWTLRNMSEKLKAHRSMSLLRRSGLGRGQKGEYVATGNGWDK